MLTPILAVVFLVLLALACAWLRLHHARVPWLAGRSTTAVMLATGAALAAGIFVPKTWWQLAPAWLGYLVVAVVHLSAAREEVKTSIKLPPPVASGWVGYELK